MLTVFDNDENIFNAIKAGADGYLLKEVNPKDLQQGILETINGGATMTPSIAMKTLKLFRNPIDLENKNEAEEIKLTVREIEFLEQLSKGLKYNDISENLFYHQELLANTSKIFTTNSKFTINWKQLQRQKSNNLI